MPRFEVKQSSKLHLTSYSGLALIGQCCQLAQVEAVIDPKIPVSQGMRTSDIVKSVVGLLSLGKSDFEAIEAFRGDRFFKEALGLSKVPGAVWMRQRLDAKAGAIRELADELTLRLLTRAEAPITAYRGYVCVDIDTFAMDNSGTKKEAVARTYQGFDGYTPIAGYIGNEGWNIGQRNGILLRAAVPPHRTSAPGEAVRVAPGGAVRAAAGGQRLRQRTAVVCQGGGTGSARLSGPPLRLHLQVEPAQTGQGRLGGPGGGRRRLPGSAPSA